MIDHSVPAVIVRDVTRLQQVRVNMLNKLHQVYRAWTRVVPFASGAVVTACTNCISSCARGHRYPIDGSVKQYLRDHILLRNEAISYNTRDLGVGKSIRNLPQLRRVMRGINDRYLPSNKMCWRPMSTAAS
jgi:hypothetical protein